MTPVDRTSHAGRAYLDLQNHARRQGQATQQLLTFYALERWLARLAASRFADQFILKGGLLLAAVDVRRPTVDADTLARGIPSDHDAIAAAVVEIATLPDLDGSDGITYDAASVRTRTIREEGLYAGVRVTFTAELATAQIKVSLDINFGDPVTPGPRPVQLPSVRPGSEPVTVLGYPLETVLAEKISTAIALGDANSRMKDYADIWTLTGRHAFERRVVAEALTATAGHRGIELAPLSTVTADLVTLRARNYATYRSSLTVDGQHLPEGLADVIADVTTFADALVDGGTGTTWDFADRRWT